MRLTSEQRIAALERDNIVLHDTIQLLHKMLKEQRQLINDYITEKVASQNKGVPQNDNTSTENALYTFMCKRRFDHLEKRLENIRKSVARSQTLKAG